MNDSFQMAIKQRDEALRERDEAQREVRRLEWVIDSIIRLIDGKPVTPFDPATQP